jgi:hypothetical protein
MSDIHDVMDVTMDDLSPKQRIQLEDAIDQFQQKCLMSFGENRSGVPYLKSDMPTVLLPGEPDTTSAEEKQEAMNAVRQTMEKPPADFTKFSAQDDTSTMEHIARYLMQLGEASADEVFRIRYFPLSLIGPAFT